MGCVQHFATTNVFKKHGQTIGKLQNTGLHILNYLLCGSPTQRKFIYTSFEEAQGICCS